jgi:hypothetical protein
MNGNAEEEEAEEKEKAEEDNEVCVTKNNVKLRGCHLPRGPRRTTACWVYLSISCAPIGVELFLNLVTLFRVVRLTQSTKTSCRRFTFSFASNQLRRPLCLLDGDKYAQTNVLFSYLFIWIKTTEQSFFAIIFSHRVIH